MLHLRSLASVSLFVLGIGPSLEAQARSGVLTGTVLTDSTRVPIEGAEVSLAQVGTRAWTTATGRFRIGGIPAGTHEVVVRQLGFSPVTIHIAFAGNDSVDRTIVLRPPQTLEAVNVEAEVVIPSFEEHRAIGLGTFITRAELAQKEQLRMSEVVTQVRGVRIQNTGAGRAFLYSSRRMSTSIDPRGTKGSSGATGTFARENAGTGGNMSFCYAQVYLNDQLVYRGAEGEPLFDINSVTPNQVEAIEYYAGPGSTPLRYSRMNSNCGVIVIHLRRTPRTPKPS